MTSFKRYRGFLICLLLASVTLLVYWPAGHLGFTSYDDHMYVYENAHVQKGLTWEGVGWAFTTADASNWHPVTWLSLMLDCQFFGLRAAWYHWENVLFHIVNTLLLFFLFKKITGSVWRSAVVAALFAWHPMHVQSVVWISERKDLLSGLFFLLTLWAYERYVSGAKCQVSGRDPEGGANLPVCRWRWYGLALLFFALGLMSKPMLVTIPVVLLLLDFWPFKRMQSFDKKSIRSLLLEKVPFAVLSGISSLVTFWAQARGGAVFSSVKLPLYLRAADAPVFYTSYLEKLAWPANLSVFYPYPRMQIGEFIWSALTPVVLTVLFVRKARTCPYLLIGWLWFVVMLIPVIGLVQVGGQSIADRYTYLPAIGLFVSIVWFVAEMGLRSVVGRVCGIGASVVLLMGCIFDARVQLSYWQDDITLFQHAVDITHGSYCYFSLGNAYLNAGNFEKAAENYGIALNLNSNFPKARYMYGYASLSANKYPEAEAQFRQLLEADPNNPFVRKMLGDALTGEKRFIEAYQEYESALRFKPADSVIQDALQKCRYLEALERQPESAELLNDLAWLLAASPNKPTRDGTQAVVYGEKACELTHFKMPVMIGTLAAAYAEAGQFDKAIATAEKACAVASEAGQAELLKRNTELLELYRQHKPYHEPAAP